MRTLALGYDFRYNTRMFPKSHPITVRAFQKPYPFEIYAPEGKGPFPVIFQTPILGRFVLLDDLFFERRFARFFAVQGIACVLIHRPIFEFNTREGLEQIQQYLENSLKRNQSILEYVLQDPRLDHGNLGTFGMSFGGIINCLWAALEPRFKAHVFALAGGNLPEIFIRSRDPLMRSYQRSALAAAGFNHKTLKRHLKHLFTRDPFTAASLIPSHSVFLILGLLDRVVPFHFGNKLRKRLKHPKTLYLPLGHYFSILTVPIVKWLVVNFFKKKYGFFPPPKKI